MCSKKTTHFFIKVLTNRENYGNMFIDRINL